MAMNTTLVFLGEVGERSLKIRDLFQFKGEDHLKLEKGELLVRIEVPLSAADTRSCYRKIRARGSIDFPQLGVAIVAKLEDTKIESLEICVGAISPTPKMIKGLDSFLGEPLSDEVIEKIAGVARKQCRPQGAVAGGDKWRREMVAVEVELGLAGLR
jgi:CO/xanthine dehydrogenase FAD-binding subunit